MSRVALIAIAKDEGAYLHEWIHHHLYLGFSPIIIGVNRTTDSSIDILKKISYENKNVKFEVLDWIDKGVPRGFKNFQTLSYAYLSNKLEMNTNDYFCFLDIDEFWFSRNGNKIDKFISDNKGFDIASFPWFCQLGEDTAFQPPFKDAKVNKNKHVKSIVKVNVLSKSKMTRAHVPEFFYSDYESLIHIDQNGERTSCVEVKGVNDPFPNISSTKFEHGILHRMIRSEEEYISLVLRGRPDGRKIKSNGRSGFSFANDLLINPFGDEYYISLNRFIKNYGLSEIIAKSRVEKINYYKNAIHNMSVTELIKESIDAYKALNGTVGLSFFSGVFLEKVKDASALRDFAILLEKDNLNLSYELMLSASKMRPGGLFIQEKIMQYNIVSSK